MKKGSPMWKSLFSCQLYAFPAFFSDTLVYSSQETHIAKTAPIHTAGLASERLF